MEALMILIQIFSRFCCRLSRTNSHSMTTSSMQGGATIIHYTHFRLESPCNHRLVWNLFFDCQCLAFSVTISASLGLLSITLLFDVRFDTCMVIKGIFLPVISILLFVLLDKVSLFEVVALLLCSLLLSGLFLACKSLRVFVYLLDKATKVIHSV